MFRLRVTSSSGTDGYFTFPIPFDKTSYMIPARGSDPTLPLGTPYNVSEIPTWGAATPINPPTDFVVRYPD